jgi:hypothetical protein
MGRDQIDIFQFLPRRQGQFRKFRNRLKAHGFGASDRPVAASRGATAQPSSGDLICPSGNRSSPAMPSASCEAAQQTAALPVRDRPCKRWRHRCLPRKRHVPAGPVAQWLEPAAHNGLVPGSSPGRPTSLRSRSEQGCRAEAHRAKAGRASISGGNVIDHLYRDRSEHAADGYDVARIRPCDRIWTYFVASGGPVNVCRRASQV